MNIKEVGVGVRRVEFSFGDDERYAGYSGVIEKVDSGCVLHVTDSFGNTDSDWYSAFPSDSGLEPWIVTCAPKIIRRLAGSR